MGITTVLTIIFIVLKLVGVIHWSWWVVFLPTLIAILANIFLQILLGIADDKSGR